MMARRKIKLTAGVSLREKLQAQLGVTSLDALKWHLNNAYEALRDNPDAGFMAYRYRPDPNHPNRLGGGRFVNP